MERRFTVLTIGAKDLAAMKNFYEEKLGWKPTAENKDILFYQMNGFLLSIARKSLLTDFIGFELSERPSFTIGYNVTTEEEVRNIYNSLKSKDVKILKEPTMPPFGGLFFYFQDVEGNILEVAYNSYIPLDKDNNAIGHKPIDDL